MLVLTRKKGESIQIADDIRITVADVRGGRVRLSIDAPKCVRVLRQEIAVGVEPEKREFGQVLLTLRSAEGCDRELHEPL